ncbi:MAG: homoserine kinase [Alkaliphilus sp.]|nr:homoserine kinase [Alkaliphilus sp.]
MKPFILKVPATTANMGSGFDTIGMALKLFNEYEVEEISKGIEVVGTENISLENNLVYSSMLRTLKKYGHMIDGIRICAKEINIPINGGLGSSAASIVGGIMIANQIMGNNLTSHDIICLGTEIEGHPDNIAPAVLGGLTVSIYEEGNITCSKVKVPENLRFAIMFPTFSVSTQHARNVLPALYSKSDCIFNISRVALLIAAMSNGETDKLRMATEDRIHQPYRAILIPDMNNVFSHAKELGAKAEVISGSGSTLMAIIDESNRDFQEGMQKYLDTLKEKWVVKVLEVDTEGATIK